MTLNSDETIRRYADLACPVDYARDLASKMVETSREAHDFAGLTRWVRRYAELRDGQDGQDGQVGQAEGGAEG